MQKNGKPLLTALVLMLTAAVLLALRLEDVPPPWFDEGWLLSVARNWVAVDHYGQLRSGEPVSGDMPSVGIPAIAPIALSFKAFGIGVWQGRLPGILFTLAALWFLYCIASYICGGDVAFWALFAALFMSTLPSISPLIIGRQALGEMPGLFFLLGGYLVLCRARENPWRLLLVSLLWGLTVATKLLFLPFLAIGILLPAALLALQKRFRDAILLLVLLAATLAVSQSVALLETWVRGKEAGFEGTSIPFVITAIVPVPHIRITAFRTLLLAAIPTILGLLNLISDARKRPLARKSYWGDYMSVSLLACVISWVTWYLLMSYGWPRYLFPPLFIGSIFVGALMAKVTSRLDPCMPDLLVVREGAQKRWRTIKRIILRVILAGTIPLSIFNLYWLYVSTPRSSLAAVVEYLNSSTRPESLIETYDMELLFLLNRRYHYPPKELQISLNQRTFGAENTQIDYDPLSSNPDYLIIGPHGAMWHLYDHVVEAGDFRLLREFPLYRIYIRER